MIRKHYCSALPYTKTDLKDWIECEMTKKGTIEERLLSSTCNINLSPTTGPSAEARPSQGRVERHDDARSAKPAPRNEGFREEDYHHYDDDDDGCSYSYSYSYSYSSSYPTPTPTPTPPTPPAPTTTSTSTSKSTSTSTSTTTTTTTTTPAKPEPGPSH